MTWHTLDIPEGKIPVVNTMWEMKQEDDGLVKFQDTSSEKCFYIWNYKMFQLMKRLVIEQNVETPMKNMIEMWLDFPECQYFLQPAFGMFTQNYQTLNY